MTDEFLPFSRPSISREAIDEVVACLESGWITTGPRVKKFEEELQRYFSAPHALALSSATAGLHLAFAALEMKPGDEVITTPMTFAATLNTIVLTGGRPVLVDVEPDTYNMDVSRLAKAITQRTRAIVPVHFAGLPANLPRIQELAASRRITLAEDAAHAIGAAIDGKRVGSWGSFASFSFYANKNMTTGEGGMLTSGRLTEEQRNRLDVLLTRTERNVSVHPSTRLPGTNEIEREIKRYMDAGGAFAVCYADLDHFKEYNDRYSYNDGDRVIFLLSRILHDVVKGIFPSGFVGHIGGDDFILVLPLDVAAPCCSEIITVFDLLIPFQYSDQDRRAGYFFGKDRRGQLHRVPLMTLSIGIVTNEHRRFSHPAQVSELATEMKSYAKTLPGSVFVFDRRRDVDAGDVLGAQASA